MTNNISRQYAKEVHDHLAYRPTWFPNAPIQLGDVGILKGPIFERLTSLEKLNIPFEILKGTEPVDFSLTSQSGFKVKARASGTVGAADYAAQAGLYLEFDRAGAFIFQAKGCSVEEIQDKVALGKRVGELYSTGGWESDWCVVNTVVKSQFTTIVIANSQNASLDLSASGPLELDQLTKADAGIAVHHQSGDLIQFIAAQGLVPLIKISRGKSSVLSRLFGQPLLFGGPGRSGSVQMEELSCGTGQSILDPEEEEVLEEVLPGEEDV